MRPAAGLDAPIAEDGTSSSSSLARLPLPLPAAPRLAAAMLGRKGELLRVSLLPCVKYFMPNLTSSCLLRLGELLGLCSMDFRSRLKVS